MRYAASLAGLLLLAAAVPARAELLWPFDDGVSGPSPGNALGASKQLTLPVLGQPQNALGASKQGAFIVLDPSIMAISKQVAFVVIIPASGGIVPMSPMTGFR